MNSWTFWYDRKDTDTRDDNWDQFLTKICQIERINEFWIVVNNMIEIEELPVNSNLHFFKSGIEPKWEDNDNLEGGKWVYSIKRDFSKDANLVWQSTILGCISGFRNKEYASFINGAVLSSKKNSFRISLWTKTANCKKTQLFIGNLWKDSIAKTTDLNRFNIEYFPHKINLKKAKRLSK